jgi:hypothetical protein
LCHRVQRLGRGTGGFLRSRRRIGEAAKQPRFEAESYTATVKGHSQTAIEFGVAAGTVKCGSLELSGSISKATSSQTLSPFYLECKFTRLGATYEVFIFANSCNYVLHAVNTGPPYAGDFGLSCPVGSPGYQFAVRQSGETICTITYPVQSGVTGIGLGNLGSGKTREVEASFSLTGLKYTQAGTNPLFCKPGEYANGTYTGDVLFKAEK